MISKRETQRVAEYLHNEELEQVTEFCYLGSMITTDARCQKEIKIKIVMSKEAFKQKRRIIAQEPVGGAEKANGEDLDLKRGTVRI